MSINSIIANLLLLIYGSNGTNLGIKKRILYLVSCSWLQFISQKTNVSTQLSQQIVVGAAASCSVSTLTAIMSAYAGSMLHFVVNRSLTASYGVVALLVVMC